MKTFPRLLFATSIGLAVSAGGPALAVTSDPPPVPTCGKGKVYDKKKGMCVQLQGGVVDDDSLAAYAWQLARAERYEEALEVLGYLQEPGTAEALNYRGYITRKLGRVDEGIGYYKQAVALDPDYTLVREYLGEAYVTQGKLDLARAELAEIEKRCGTTCEEYQDLAEAIEAAAQTRS